MKIVYHNETEVIVNKEELEKLLERSNWLDCLENAGVDNWDGIDFAFELLKETRC